VGRPRHLLQAPSLLPYVIRTPTTVEEFDFPTGAGILDPLRWAKNWAGPPAMDGQRFQGRAMYLKERGCCSGGSFTPRSLLLQRRPVKDRLEALAPFLGFESEPYLSPFAVGGQSSFPSEQHSILRC